MVDLSSGMPNWLKAMLEEKFFNPCMIHDTAKKNERNIFCLDCCSSFCPQCLRSHRLHRLLQIRRYVYHDVVRVDDLEKLIDCSSVQVNKILFSRKVWNYPTKSYRTNNAKVVFLNERAQSQPFRSSGNACRSCDRPLQDHYLFCSLSCKVKLLSRSEGALAKALRECELLSLQSLCELDESQLTPDSILEFASATSSGSSGGCGAVPRATRSAAEAVSLAWRRRGRAFGPGVVNRRKKGVPRRAPLL